MEIKKKKEKTGKILNVLSGDEKTLKQLAKGKTYIEGSYHTPGYIHRGKFVKKEYPHPEFPADHIFEAVSYAGKGKEACLKALENIGMTQTEAANYIQKEHHIFRAGIYPSTHDFLDAEVKINSGDPELIQQGKLQKQKYIEDCLAVKQIFSKKEEK